MLTLAFGADSLLEGDDGLTAASLVPEFDSGLSEDSGDDDSGFEQPASRTRNTTTKRNKEIPTFTFQLLQPGGHVISRIIQEVGNCRNQGRTSSAAVGREPVDRSLQSHSHTPRAKPIAA
jgi:hypothetical protein